MTLASNAVCKMLRNLTSATKKRDPPTFRTRYEIIRLLISTEFDRLRYKPHMLTKNEDITSTLNLVEQELMDLRKSESLTEPEYMKKEKRRKLRKAIKRIKLLAGESKERLERAKLESKRKENSSIIEEEGVEDCDEAEDTN